MRNSIINRQFRYVSWNVTYIFIALNLAVFAVIQVFPLITYYLALVPLSVHFNHWIWQFVTYAFTHESFWHLFSNILAIYVFGSAVENAVGSKEFLLFYLLTGTLSGIASYFTYLGTGYAYMVILGASGAVYALMLLFSVLFPNAVLLVFGIIPIRSPLLVILYFFIEFFSRFSADGTAHMVHLYGLFFALLYVIIRMRMNPLRRWGII